MYTKRYTRNGLLIIELPAEKFQLLYWDRPKMSAKYDHCFNAGFFGYYAEYVDGKKQSFTLPVANLCADAGNISPLGIKYISEWTQGKGLAGDKVKLSCIHNNSPDFKNRYVSTLIIKRDNTVKIADISILPADCKYAVSGVPCIRGGQDVDWHRYVVKQGWSGGVMYNTYRNWIGTGGGKMFLISGRTTSPNYIYGMEFYKKTKGLGIEDCIGLDGGGSFFLRLLGKNVMSTPGNRIINSIGVIL